ncbi:tetraacyldisaccharide 4'-kinase [Helicobacter monodelphidis]|uniref:tetraacyldisaccharide 4'-kinase n=1 Tax=Helicobacter sp. 15-1451 TaxID=2004995 RepID=UPI000DCBAA94|nr:tetraacyldisaccharide 4'-kinase [Helicobacter sp. 15-1451]RAX57934.1 tetraacyldisaccharide 4'-kinase [Helicobacter sp. 15-1451]
MKFLERYFFNPSVGQKILAIALLPFSLFYALTATIRRSFSSFNTYKAAIISIGNLVVGGSGKTPLVIALAREYEYSCAIILRGYKRRSKGLYVVAHNGEIRYNVEKSGDEAQLLAKRLPNATIIVSEDRAAGIQQAIKLGRRIIFLDDGFRFKCNKLNILLKPQLSPYFPFCIPSGAYRELPSAYKSADLVLYEGKEYTREVSIKNPTERMLLVTAIANPSRLERFLPVIVGKLSYADHSFFSKEKIATEMQKYQATSLLVTEKDEVKLKDFGFPLSLLKLEMVIDSDVYQRVAQYIGKYAAISQTK